MMKKWIIPLAMAAGLVAGNANADTWYNRFRDTRDIPFTQNGTGAVARTADARLKETVSLLDFYSGSGDYTSAFQAANDYLTGLSTGGTILVPSGTFTTATVTLDSNVHIRGAGKDRTVIQLKSGTNAAVFQTRNFATLTGTNTCASPNGFELADLTVDGNRSGNSSGYGIRLYGYNYSFRGVAFINAATTNIYSEWSNAACGTNYLRVEAAWTDVQATNSAAGNIYFNGPHDTAWTNVVAGYPGSGAENIWIGPNGNGIVGNGVHAWSAVASHNFYVEAPIFCTNCEADSAGATIGWMLGANAGSIVGGSTYAQGASGASACFQFGDATHSNVSNWLINTRTTSCAGSQGTVYFYSDGGNNVITGPSYQGSGGSGANGSWYTGTPHASTDWDVNLAGGVSCYPSGPAGMSACRRITKASVVGTVTTPLTAAGYATFGVGDTTGGILSGFVGNTEYSRWITNSGQAMLQTLPAVPLRFGVSSTDVGGFSSTGTFDLVFAPKLPLTGYVKGNGASVAASASATVPTTDLSGTLQAAQEPAHTGDVTNSAGSLALTIANNAVTNAKSAQMAANTVKGNFTGSTANAADNAMPSCTDASGNHLNYTSGSGFSCGTSSPADGAWATYTPTATFPGAAPTTYTTSGRYKRIGTKTYVLQAKINITTLGPGSGQIDLSLPNSSTTADTFPCAGTDASAGSNIQYASTGGAGSAAVSIVAAGGMAAHQYFVVCTYEAQ